MVYWSSSQYDPYSAWLMHFGNGSVVGYGKDGYGQVRAVRAF